MNQLVADIDDLVEIIAGHDAQDSEPIGWGHPTSVAFRNAQRSLGGSWPVPGVKPAWRAWRASPGDEQYRDGLVSLLMEVSALLYLASTPVEDELHHEGDVTERKEPAGEPVAVEGLQESEEADSSDAESRHHTGDHGDGHGESESH